MKGRNSIKALEIFQRMKRDQCQPSTDTYTLLINLYGKVIAVVVVYKLEYKYFRVCVIVVLTP